MVERMNLAYVAGIIDGEGCIQIKNWVKLVLVIANTDRRLITSLFDSFGGSVREYADKRPYMNGRLRKPMYYWYLRGPKAEKLLKDCYNFLLIKKDQADIVFSIRSSIPNSYHTVPTHEQIRRKYLCTRLSELKRKGLEPF